MAFCPARESRTARFTRVWLVGRHAKWSSPSTPFLFVCTQFQPELLDRPALPGSSSVFLGALLDREARRQRGSALTAHQRRGIPLRDDEETRFADGPPSRSNGARPAAAAGGGRRVFVAATCLRGAGRRMRRLWPFARGAPDTDGSTRSETAPRTRPATQA